MDLGLDGKSAIVTGGSLGIGTAIALTLAQAAGVIKQAGGVPVLAHPGAYDSSIDPITLVRNAKAAGVEGVEVFYPYNQGYLLSGDRSRWIARIDALADELGLLKTGGSDFHGRPHDIIQPGDMGLTNEQFAAFKQGWQTLRVAGG